MMRTSKTPERSGSSQKMTKKKDTSSSADLTYQLVSASMSTMNTYTSSTGPTAQLVSSSNMKLIGTEKMTSKSPRIATFWSMTERNPTTVVSTPMVTSTSPMKLTKSTSSAISTYIKDFTTNTLRSTTSMPERSSLHKELTSSTVMISGSSTLETPTQSMVCSTR